MDNEYFIKVWGGMFNNNAYPSIEKDLGIKEGCYYFSDKADYLSFMQKINNPIYANQGSASVKKYGIMTHKRTIAKVICIYKDNSYQFECDFDYEYEEDSARYMFMEGNYSCDCNLSMFIQEKYPDFPELECGDEITIDKLEIIYKD